MEQINTLPHNEDIERTLLGSFINYAEAFDVCREYVDADCFYNDFNRKVYKTIASLVREGNPTDVIFTIQKFKSLYSEENELPILDMGYTLDYIKYAQLLRQLSMQRSLINMACRVKADCASTTTDVADTFSYIRRELDAIEYKSSSTDLVDMQRATSELYKIVNDNLNGLHSSSILTGFKMADDVGGLLYGTLFVVAAESGQGKTTFALNLADHAAQLGHKVGFYSMEMTTVDLTAKLVSMRTSIPTSVLQNKKLTSKQLQDFDNALAEIQKLPMYFHTKGEWSADSIYTDIRRLVRKMGVKLVFVDYVQRFNFDDGHRARTDEANLADAVNKLKSLAKDLNICIVALSQLSKDYVNPEPDINRLRGSGQIREVADQIILLYRPEVYERKELKFPHPYESKDTHDAAWISFAKGRRCKEFSFLCGFDGNSSKFFDAEIHDALPCNERKVTSTNPYRPF